MRCPSCNQWLIGAEYNDVEIDYCPACGIWLDDRELELLAATAGSDQKKIELSLSKSTLKTKRFCPRCNIRLQPAETHAGINKVILDQCPAGHGLWFDKGELEKVAISFAQETSPVLRTPPPAEGDKNPSIHILLTFIQNLFRHSPFNPGKL